MYRCIWLPHSVISLSQIQIVFYKLPREFTTEVKKPKGQIFIKYLLSFVELQDKQESKADSLLSINYKYLFSLPFPDYCVTHKTREIFEIFISTTLVSSADT